MNGSPLFKMALLVVLLTGGVPARAEWRVRYKDEFRAMMQRAGHPVPEYVGHYASEAECRAAIRAAESGDPSLRGRMEAVEFGRQQAASGSGAWRSTQPSYESVRAAHDRIVAGVLRDQPPMDPLSPLKQLEASVYLSTLHHRSKYAGNAEMARALNDFSNTFRMGYERTAAREVPGVPRPTRVQQEFFEFVAQETAAVLEALQQLKKQYFQTHDTFSKAVAKVDDLKARLPRTPQPAPPSAGPAGPVTASTAQGQASDKLETEAQALLAEAMSEQKASLDAMVALSKAMTLQEKELQALSRALETATAQPERSGALLKDLKGGKP